MVQRLTTILTFELDEASAKVRSGIPIDDEEDMQLPIWSGLIPLEAKRGVPVADDGSTSLELPGHLSGMK